MSFAEAFCAVRVAYNAAGESLNAKPNMQTKGSAIKTLFSMDLQDSGGCCGWRQLAAAAGRDSRPGRSGAGLPDTASSSRCRDSPPARSCHA